MQDIAKRIENELAKEKTDRKTWKLVNDFWAITQEISNLEWYTDRVELLEIRMVHQHGWCR